MAAPLSGRLNADLASQLPLGFQTHISPVVPQPDAPPEEDPNRVDVRNTAYRAMQRRWALTRDLRGGTETMRDNAGLWLPQEPGEEESAYAVRLGRTFLFGAYDDAIEQVVAQPFSRPLKLEGESALPEELRPLFRNADRTGRSLTQFAREVFDAAVDFGLTHVLVDFPKAAASLNLRQQRDLDVRPYFVHVPPPNLIGWRTAVGPVGVPEVRQVRILESRQETVGSYGDRIVPHIRVIDFIHETDLMMARSVGIAPGSELFPKGRHALWRHRQPDERGDETPEPDPWELIDEGVHDYVGSFLVTLYVNRAGLLTGTPPLLKLAEMNLMHFQNSSDQNNILRFARFPILFGKGFSNEQVEKGITIGPSRGIFTTNENADLRHVEHGGSAIKAGRDHLDDILRTMVKLGLDPFVEKVQNQTARGQEIDATKQEADAQVWVRSLEAFLRECYETAAGWVDGELPDDFEIDVHDDFSAIVRSNSQLDDLYRARINGDIDRLTYLEELQSARVISERRNLTEINSRAEAEMAAMTREPRMSTEPRPDDDVGARDDEEN